MSHVAAANRYVADVLSGRQPACKWTRLACERQKRDLARQKEPGWPFRFDKVKAERACRFMELQRHIKGEWAGQQTVLQPWQSFIYATVFGWVHKAGPRKGARRFRQAYTEIPKKSGKALAIDTPIATPQGWKNIGDLDVGDRVFDERGAACAVIGVTEVMVGRPCYRVVFSDGGEIVADAEHEWMTSALRWPGLRGPKPASEPRILRPAIRTTRQIASTLRAGAANNHSVPVAEALDCAEVDLPIPPYALGAWLGNGDTGSAGLTCHNDDVQIAAEIRAEGVALIEGPRQGNGRRWRLSDGDRSVAGRARCVQVRLRALGVLGDKHIPLSYMRASIGQRMALLQGLLDTDGYVGARGQIELTLCCRRLAFDAIDLLRSLGFKPTFSISDAKIAGRVVGLRYRIRFHDSRGKRPFRLARKVARLQTAPPRNAPRSMTRQIVACEPVASVPVRCIEVDSPSHLYLAGRHLIPTHNSLMGSQVGLYLFAADGEAGAEVYSAATTRDQAKIVWSTARLMCKRSPGMCRSLGISIGAHALSIERTAATFQALSADADNIEGKNPHGAIVDELHAHATRLVLDNLLTAQGARRQPLMWIITTAGFNRHGVGYEQNSLARKVLEGTIADETLFAIVYTIDEGDDPFSELAQRKANPNFGVSVSADFLANQARLALQSSQFLPSYLTKHLDVWTSADHALFDLRAWNARCRDETLTIEQFEGCEVDIGLDLASKTDLAAKVRLFQRQIDGVVHYYVFGTWYLPRAVVDDPRLTHYAGWEADGRLTVTDGDTIDMATIRSELFEDGKTFRIREIAYDPWQATQLAQELQAEGVPVIEYRQTVQNFSEPTKTLAALILEGRIHHDGDPVLAWMMSNVVGHYDAKDNVYPRKEKAESKIDGAIGLIMALGRALVRQEAERSVYEREDRGFVVLG